jgi:crooked neck
MQRNRTSSRYLQSKFRQHLTYIQYALDHIPKKEAQELYKMWISFEKKNGDKAGIEDVILSKRRFQYEEELKANPHNYDVWFDYTRLEETYGEYEKAQDLYERAIVNLPPKMEKRYWARYIYLWINYAIFVETEVKNIEKTREIYKVPQILIEKLTLFF